MPQTLFPVYPTDIKMINSKIGVKTIGEKIFYFNEGGVIYKHEKGDYQSFRYITSQMIELKLVRHKEVISFFQVSKESVNRWIRVYREKSAKGFFGTKKGIKRGNVLTKEILPQIQEKLNLGTSVKEIGDFFGIKPDTIQKAIQSGRLTKPEIKKTVTINEKTQSQRSTEDSQASLGVGCTNETGRIEAMKKKR
jgi:transposase